MSQSEQFRQYAEEALLSIRQSKDENETQAFADLAHVWVLAAFESERATPATPSVRTISDTHRALPDLGFAAHKSHSRR